MKVTCIYIYIYIYIYLLLTGIVQCMLQSSTYIFFGAMPPKPTSCDLRAKVVCDLCRAAVVDGKEDALQCEGSCGSWYHRYCAGVSLTSFRELSNSSTPFVCSQKAHETTVVQLQSEVDLLRAEVAELRAALHCKNVMISLTQSVLPQLHV